MRTAKATVAWLLFVLVVRAPGSAGLKNVSIEVPTAVRVGEDATLECRYDLEGESLYMVKWYKGRREFYRFVPKELPNTRVFPVPAVDVDVNLSGANRVVLRNVRRDLAAKYRCEVSADAPSFHTQVVASTMHVVHAPDGVPNLILEKSRYSIGDTLRGNCTSPPSTPAANITWYINDKQVNATFYDRSRLAAIEKRRGGGAARVELGAPFDGTRLPDLYATKAGLQFEVNAIGPPQLRIACVADLFRTFSTRAEIVLSERRAKLELASVVYTTVGVDSTSRCPSTMLLQKSKNCAILIYVTSLLISSYASSSLPS